ncbi:hypothetical protein FRC08_010017 [Ceratobasidium sp. 394]|nr:hypothetical protein FRC08_010017 [Ceratobasidium sp. 394]
MPNRHSSRAPHDQIQTPGAGPSRLSPLPILALPTNADTSIRDSSPRVSVAVCDTGPVPQEVELGTFLVPDKLSPSSDGHFPRRGSAGSIVSIKVSTPTKSFFLANSTWRTDILTFCSHARIDTVLGDARITHIQARKSRRPPFLHEYILVFFTAAGGQRFVIRIDRLGKVGSTSSGWPLGWCTGRYGVAANTAIQEVGLYHIQDAQSGIDSPDGTWLAMDGRWGSYPIATLATWESAKAAGMHVSHHIQTAADGSDPRLKDVSRLLEAILLEMPTYHLTTTNCYFMTRTSLLLLQRCYPTAFTCYLGSMSGELVPASDLTEPVWTGVIRWYLPLVVLFFMAYVPVVVVVHLQFTKLTTCLGIRGCDSKSHYYQTRWELAALRFALHSIIDVPLPIGIMHAYTASLELSMSKLVERLSGVFLGTREDGNVMPLEEPFGLFSDGAWNILAAWCALGGGFAVLIFISLLVIRYGMLILFIVMLFGCVWFNLKFGNSADGMSESIAGVYS